MRAQSVDDAEALHEAYGDVELMRWSSPPHGSIAESRHYLAAGAGERWRGWTLVGKDSGNVIGMIAAAERQAGVAEIGYLLIRRYWGQGYAREAVGRLIDLLVVEGKHRLYADTDPDNLSSRRLLESLGFVHEDTLVDEWETHIGLRDSAIYGLCAAEWRAAA